MRSGSVTSHGRGPTEAPWKTPNSSGMAAGYTRLGGSLTSATPYFDDSLGLCEGSRLHGPGPRRVPRLSTPRRCDGSPASSTDLASGSAGAEHPTSRLLHPGESRAETRCVAGEELNRRAPLALQRGRDPCRQGGGGGALADDLDVALAQVTAAQPDLEDPVCSRALVRILVSVGAAATS